MPRREDDSENWGGSRRGAGKKMAAVGTFVIDAVPAMGDVFSGSVARPQEFAIGENPLPRLTQTTAWQRVKLFIKSRRYEVLAKRGDGVTGKLAGQITNVRDFLGEDDAIVVMFGRSVLVAFNADGTRAAVTDIEAREK